MVLLLHLMNTCYMNDDGFNSKVSVVPSEKDLGVWITSKPDFSLHAM